MSNTNTRNRMNQTFVYIADTIVSRSPDMKTAFDIGSLMAQSRELYEDGAVTLTFHDGSTMDLTRNTLLQMDRVGGVKPECIPNQECDAVHTLRKHDSNLAIIKLLRKREHTGVTDFNTPQGKRIAVRFPDTSYLLFDGITYHLIALQSPRDSIAEGFFRRFEKCEDNGWSLLDEINQHQIKFGGDIYKTSDDYTLTGVLFCDGSELILGFCDTDGGDVEKIVAEGFNDVETRYPYGL